MSGATVPNRRSVVVHCRHDDTMLSTHGRPPSPLGCGPARRTGELTRRSRHTEALLLVHLGEIDARRLYLREACSSLFAYCTERLHFSEGEAFYRVAAARAAREHAVILEMLADGRLHLTAVALLAPHLTATNRDAVLSRAVHRSKRQVLELVAELAPRPDVRSPVRKLPSRQPPAAAPLPSAAAPRASATAPLLSVAAPALEPRPANVDRCEWTLSPQSASPDCSLPSSEPPARTRTPAIESLAPGRYRVQFTASAQLRDKLERLRAMMRSTVPDGDLATIIEAVTEKLARLERQRSAATERPRKSLAETDVAPSSRHVPAAVKRAVRARDGDQCAYRDEKGPSLHRARVAGTPPPAPIWPGRRPLRRERRPPVSGAQPLPRGDRLRHSRRRPSRVMVAHG